MGEWREHEPCDKHSFCLKHVTHPCEGCGRIAGVSLPPAWHDYIAQLEADMKTKDGALNTCAIRLGRVKEANTALKLENEQLRTLFRSGDADTLLADTPEGG